MRLVNIAAGFLVAAFFAVVACSERGGDSSSPNVDGGYGGGGDDAGVPNCEGIPFSQSDVPCDLCIRANCCPELAACAKAAPNCPYQCAGGDPYQPDCYAVLDIANRVRLCGEAKCKQECWPYCPKFPCSQASSTSSGGGGAGGASSTSSGGG